jgi:hypothetical protein
LICQNKESFKITLKNAKMTKLILKLYYYFLPWKPVNLFLPKEDETVWLFSKNDGFVWLGSLVWTGGRCRRRRRSRKGWLWTVSNGIVYSEGRKIVSECEADDDYNVTHFRRLPKLPKKK